MVRIGDPPQRVLWHNISFGCGFFTRHASPTSSWVFDLEISKSPSRTSYSEQMYPRSHDLYSAGPKPIGLNRTHPSLGARIVGKLGSFPAVDTRHCISAQHRHHSLGTLPSGESLNCWGGEDSGGGRVPSPAAGRPEPRHFIAFSFIEAAVPDPPRPPCRGPRAIRRVFFRS